jgi:hypothetical protein
LGVRWLGLSIVPLSIGTCPICGKSGTLEEEHIVPQWIEKIVCHQGPFTTRSQGDARSEPRAALEITIQICPKCNRRLGRHFEDSVIPHLKPILESPGTHHLLNKAAKKAITRWIVKTSILSLHRLAGERVAPLDLYEWLCLPGRKPPPYGTSVWIGKFVNDTALAGVPRCEVVEPTLNPGRAWKDRFVIGPLAAYVLFESVVQHGPLTHPAEEWGFLTRCSTYNRDAIIWPPRYPMDIERFRLVDDAVFVLPGYIGGPKHLHVVRAPPEP